MDINNIIELFSQLGFPIVAYYLMYNMCNNQIAKNTEAINELNKTLLKLEGDMNG